MATNDKSIQIFTFESDRGGGPEVIFIVLTYFVAPVMGDQELFTKLKNIALVQSYGSSKLATTRTFSRNSPYLYRKI